MNITRDNPALVRKIPWPRSGHLPPVLSIVEIDPPTLVLSAFYRSDNALIMRCYNPTQQAVSGTITLGLPVARVEHIRLDETVMDTLTIMDGRRILVEVRAGEVFTIRVMP